MKVGGLRVGHPSGNDLAPLLLAARQGALTYRHVGSTLDPERFEGPEIRSHHLDVGTGPVAFAAARQALRSWAPQRAIGAHIEPSSQVVAPGATVLVVLRWGPFTVVAPDRVVAVIDEPQRFAFAYGTLPGHPERGEESFSVETLPDDTVRATIRVQARPGTALARATAPIVRWLQGAALRAYLRAIALAVAETEAGPTDRRRR